MPAEDPPGGEGGRRVVQDDHRREEPEVRLQLTVRDAQAANRDQNVGADDAESDGGESVRNLCRAEIWLGKAANACS